VLTAALAVVLLLAAGSAARAHETDQYTLPSGRDFADLGPQLSHSFLAAVRTAVADTNAAIDVALVSGAGPRQLEELQSVNRVSSQVWAQLFATFPTNEWLDLGLVSASTRARYPGLVTMYRPVESIYDDPLLLLDVSKLVRTFLRAGTVSAGGVLFGTDKIIHFVNLGRIYHSRYLDAVAQGLSERDAALHAVTSTASNRWLSEDGLLGLYTTGIRSNGDLAANYAGLKFYRNLTEAVRVGPKLLPPMLQREGPHWRLAIEDEAAVFTAFVSPHWNEVLNPNTYLHDVGERMRGVIGERCDDVLDWYRDGHGRPLDQAWFAARQRELARIDGEPYGHKLEAEHPASVAEICGPARDDVGAAPAQAVAGHTMLGWGATLPPAQTTTSGVDALGRSALWWAAAAGDTAALERLLDASVEALDRPDLDGETPLHAAVRHGQVRAAALLLARGVDANRAASHGVRPLLLAAAGGHVELSGALLQAGADPNAQDRFGRTALHEAAQRGDLALAMLLLRHGADAMLASRHGSDALQIARRAGHDALWATLHDSAPVARKRGITAQELSVSLPYAVPGVGVQAEPIR
jgi:hypothetical protein